MKCPICEQPITLSHEVEKVYRNVDKVNGKGKYLFRVINNYHTLKEVHIAHKACAVILDED